MPPIAPSDLYAELQRQYDLLTARLADLDRDAGLALSEYDRAIHRDRRALVAAHRETAQSYLAVIEKNEPVPDPWLVKLASADKTSPARSACLQATRPARLLRPYPPARQLLRLPQAPRRRAPRCSRSVRLPCHG